MKRTSKLIVTTILVLAMLFGVMSTTVAAMTSAVQNDGGAASQTGSSTTASGSLITGWCDITYNEDGVLVVITPDVEAMLDVSKDQIKEIIAIVIDAAKALVIDELKDSVINSLLPDNSGSLDATGVNIDNVWSMAIDGYIGDKYAASEEPYLAFFKDAIADTENAVIAGFIDYSIDLLKSAVSLGVIAVEDLPLASNVESTVTKVFNDKVNEYINAEVDKNVTAYVNWLTAGGENDLCPITDPDVLSIIESEMQSYISGAVDNFINNDFKAPANAGIVDTVVADYLNSELKSFVDTCVRNYANGNDAANDAIDPDINLLIDAELEGWVEEVVAAWPNHTPIKNPIDELAHDELMSKLPTYVKNIINDYLTGNVTNVTVANTIKDEINLLAPAFMEEYYWANRTSGSAYTWFVAIDSEVETAVKTEIRNRNPLLDDSMVEEAYNALTTDQIKTELQNAGKSLATYIADEIADFTVADWKTVWDNLDLADQESIVAAVQADIAASDSIKDKIREEWATPGAKHDLIKEFLNGGNEAIYNEILDEVIYDAEHNTTYKHLIVDKINEKVVDVDTVVKTLRDMLRELKTENINNYNAIVQAINDKVNAKAAEDSFKNEIFVNVLGMTKAAVDARVGEFVDMFLVDYSVAIDDLNAQPPELSYTDLIKYLQEVTIDGHRVFASGHFNLDAVKALVYELPRPTEIANMTNDEMQLSYDVVIKTDFATCDFNVTAKLGGGYDYARKFAALVAEHLDVSLVGNTLTVELDVPAKLSDLLLRAANSSRVPETLKKKVFAACSKNPDDFYALINSVTFDELLELLEHVDFEEILDHEYLSRFEQLDGLTNEQIINKVAEYERYYTKLISLIHRVYAKVPDRFKSLTLMDFYRGDGEFSYYGTHSVDLEKILTKISSKYGPLVASFFDEGDLYVTATLDLKVKFEEINKVEFVIGSNTTRGFLPEGANLTYFAGVASIGGKAITGWRDQDGIVYTKMPDKDVTLTPVFASDAEIIVTVSDGIEKVYDGVAHTLNVTVDYDYQTASPVFTYQWYKNDVAIDGATAVTLDVINVADSGTYYCEVHVVDGTIDKVVASNSVIVTITPKTVDLSAYTWAPTAPFVYDGQLHEVFLQDAEGNKLQGVEYVVDANYTNFATDAGTYVAKVVILGAENLTVEGLVAYEYQWTIEKADYDMSGIKFNNASVPYDGEAHTIEVMGNLPDGVTVSYNGPFTEAGKHEVIATFHGDANHNEIEPMKATLYIIGYKTYHAVHDNEGVLILEINSANGVLETYELNMRNVGSVYSYVENEALFGEGNVGYVKAAYDIHFMDEYGVQQSVNDTFTVNLLIPAHLREADLANLKLVHVGENGEVTEHAFTTANGFITFETTHFSVYALVEAGAAPVPVEDVDLTWLWVLLIVLAVLIIIALIVFFVIRKKRKDNPDEPKSEPKNDEPTGDSGSAVAEAPAEETPAEEAPAEETPAEEAPAEEAPVEEKPVEAAPAEEKLVVPVIVGDTAMVDGKVIEARFRSSFMSRLIQSEAPIQDYYTVIKNKLLSYKGVKARMSWNFESFNKGRIQCAKINVKGKNFMLYLALDPNAYNADKYHFVNVGDKPKLDQVPMMLKVKSERGLKYALELIEEVMRVNEIEALKKPADVDYHMPYETTEQLVARDLIKVILPKGVTMDDGASLLRVNVGDHIDSNSGAAEEVAEIIEEPVIVEEPTVEEPIVEEPIVEEPTAEEPIVEEPTVEEPKAEEPAPVVPVIVGETATVDGKVVEARFRSSFMSRLIQSEAPIQDYYTIIKNKLLSYKGVKARMSWYFESFNKGRVQCAKINVKGKNFMLYLALDPNAYNADKYHFVNVGDKPKLDQVPMMLKVKSERGLKYALELIEEVMRVNEIEALKKPADVDYHMPYETTEQLVARELIKVILPKGVSMEGASLLRVNVGDHIDANSGAAEEIAEVNETPVIVEAHEIIHTDAKHADEIVTDSEATKMIELVERDIGEKGNGKLGEINLDTICENFEDGDVVTLKALKEKRLISAKVGRLKVLARGTMTKTLSIYADKFSLQAVKMITLAGGHAEQYK